MEGTSVPKRLFAYLRQRADVIPDISSLTQNGQIADAGAG